MNSTMAYECGSCGNIWEVAFGDGKPEVCPVCENTDFYRVLEGSLGPPINREGLAADESTAVFLGTSAAKNNREE